MTTEIWKSIPGVLGYEVSSIGNVRNLRGRVYKKSSNGSGYLQVRFILTNGKIGRFLVHRLVALAFIDNPCGHRVVHHIDNNPGNNRVENLEWCTHSQNIQHSIKQGRFTGHKVIHTETGRMFMSTLAASRVLGIPQKTIYNTIMGKRPNDLGLELLSP